VRSTLTTNKIPEGMGLNIYSMSGKGAAQELLKIQLWAWN